MLSDIPFNIWSVKIFSIPVSITVTQLGQIINLPDSRIYIPEVNKYLKHYALIDDFINGEQANEFAHQWSNSSILGETVECIVVPPNDDKTNIILLSREHRLDGEIKQRQENSNPSNRSSSLLSTLSSSRISNIKIDDIEKKTSLDRYHQSLNEEQYEPLTPDQISQADVSATKNSLENQTVKDDRPLCRFANKGTCRKKSNECKYRHRRCKNYESCLDSKCELAHSSYISSSSDEEEDRQSLHTPHSSRNQNSSSSTMGLRDSINITIKPCLNGINCFNAKCRFSHPNGWNPCIYGVKCKTYQCTANHPYDRTLKCRKAKDCEISDCLFLNPNTRPEKCSLREKCKIPNCSKLHPHSRSQLRTNKEDRTDPVSSNSHASKRAILLCPNEVDSHDQFCKFNHSSNLSKDEHDLKNPSLSSFINTREKTEDINTIDYNSSQLIALLCLFFFSCVMYYFKFLSLFPLIMCYIILFLCLLFFL